MRISVIRSLKSGEAVDVTIPAQKMCGAMTPPAPPVHTPNLKYNFLILSNDNPFSKY